jgi:hypothetical protein
MHLLEGYIDSSLAEVLAIEITHEVSDDWSVVVHPMITWRSQTSVTIGCEVYITTTILTSPILLQFLSILDYPSVSLHTIIAYL